MLSPEHIALIASGVSTIVASHDASGRPSLMRAVGAAITPDGTHITVYLNRPACSQLLADLQATGQIAVVFSEPFSHCAVQVKACRIELRAAGPEDAPVLARYLAGMEHELGRIGFGPTYTRIMLAHQLNDVVAVSFSPEQAFDQTPGPKAGACLPPTGDSA
ncbi:MAG: pyridoxamine 5'-phosphate oxidase family protein [Rubrivivax sp.]|nr:pyridoxamine 5'-phosphate oxidase family protein [Rubrivivax sp.]